MLWKWQKHKCAICHGEFDLAADADRFCINENPYLLKNIWRVTERVSEPSSPSRKPSADVFRLMRTPSMSSQCLDMSSIHLYIVDTAISKIEQIFMTVSFLSKYATSAESLKFRVYWL